MTEATHAVAVIGGATAGAEAAGIFSAQGVLTVVFEQNARPYGKVEDGLPRWHIALRRKEYAAIDAKLGSEHVHFVPNTTIGKDVSLQELIRDWGFHAVVLANGAWRDRPLPLEGVDAYENRGLVYQNSFIYWFNHYNEASYDGPQYEILDGTIVIGGGLASIDVVKVIQLELTARGLRERGIDVDLVEMEVAGIPATLKKHDLAWSDLGFEGCTLYYRRREEDMPLVDMPDGANDAVREKIAKSRARVLGKARDKYLFKIEPLRAPAEALAEGDRLSGIRFAKTVVESGRVRATDETVDEHGPMIISSIGSVPSPVEGIDMNGELYAFDDWDLGRMNAYPTLFGVGNVVTGKGNIVASRKHARSVAKHMSEHYLELASEVKKLEPLSTELRGELLARVAEQQKRAGYDGRYKEWIDSVTPPDRV